MSPDAITAAGIRNRAARMGQIERLQPTREAAKVKRAELEAKREGLNSKREGFATMARFLQVPNFFPTPGHIVERMIRLADLRVGQTVLEPSAGKGDIARAVLAAGVTADLLQCVELNHGLGCHLIGLGFNVWRGDFLDYAPDHLFDRVVMNPPFERGADHLHVLHAFEFLKPGGRLVAVVSNTTGHQLEQWADDHAGWVANLPEDTFRNSERPTGVQTSLVVADKNSP